MAATHVGGSQASPDGRLGRDSAQSHIARDFRPDVPQAPCGPCRTPSAASFCRLCGCLFPFSRGQVSLSVATFYTRRIFFSVVSEEKSKLSILVHSLVSDVSGNRGRAWVEGERGGGLNRETPPGGFPLMETGHGGSAPHLASRAWVTGCSIRPEVEFWIRSPTNVWKFQDCSMFVILSLLKRFNLSPAKSVIVETIMSLTSDELSWPHSLSGFDFL